MTEELIPGFRFSTASMFCGVVQSKVVDDLELRKYGYDPYSTDPPYTYMFPDNSYLCAWKDVDLFRQEIEKFSKKDAAPSLNSSSSYSVTRSTSGPTSSGSLPASPSWRRSSRRQRRKRCTAQ